MPARELCATRRREPAHALRRRPDGDRVLRRHSGVVRGLPGAVPLERDTGRYFPGISNLLSRRDRTPRAVAAGVGRSGLRDGPARFRDQLPGGASGMSDEALYEVTVSWVGPPQAAASPYLPPTPRREAVAQFTAPAGEAAAMMRTLADSIAPLPAGVASCPLCSRTGTPNHGGWDPA